MSAQAVTCEGCRRHFLPHSSRGRVTRCHPCEVEHRQLRASGPARCTNCNAVLTPHWRGDVCGFCRDPREPVPFDQLDLDELRAHARRLRPIHPGPSHSTTTGRKPRDASLDNCGRRKGGGMALWSDGNCLRCCIASMTGHPIDQVPDPTSLFRSHRDEWRAAYDVELAAKLGVRLEEIPPGGCPPVGRVRWIACLEAGPVNHAVCVNGDGLIWHDPNDNELGGLPVPRDRLLFGLRLAPVNAPRTDRWGRKLS